MFTSKSIDREQKLKFLFNIYDMDGDGYICNTELFDVSRIASICTYRVSKNFPHVSANSTVKLI